MLHISRAGMERIRMERFWLAVGVCALTILMTIGASAQTLTTLYEFCAQTNCPDGEGPDDLVQGTDGNFYGTTQGGGTTSYPGGTVFKITSEGNLTTL
jgi:uncharacterized repeat protein (TIGR03803 family)